MLPCQQNMVHGCDFDRAQNSSPTCEQLRFHELLPILTDLVPRRKAPFRGVQGFKVRRKESAAGTRRTGPGRILVVSRAIRTDRTVEEQPTIQGVGRLGKDYEVNGGSADWLWQGLSRQLSTGGIPYSYLRAVIVSTRVARRAGT